jgi:hypothetical protein
MAEMNSPSELVGKYIIVGITVLDHNDQLVEQHQLHGEIIRVENNHIVVIKQKSGDEYKLPYQANAYQDAPAGEYRLRSTGEAVVNPDLMTTWTIHRPAPDATNS